MTSVKIIVSTGTLYALMACANSTPSMEQSALIETSKTDTLIDFNTATVGKLPSGIKGFNNCGQGVNWNIVDDNGNKLLAQQAKNESSCFNVATLENKAYQHFNLSVKIKANSGEEDQGGGLIWRCQNENNYYLARYNPLENNFRFYKVVNGDRKQLKSVDSDIKSGEWFTMRVSMNGNKIICSLNDKPLIETSDDTFTNAGKVGVWSKADAQSYFDDLSVLVIK
jgi:hypothetical protein